MKGVRKAFGRLVALDGADVTAYSGEVHGLVGENGAGKTTLMNVLAGMLRPQGGEVLLGGEPTRFSKPRDAWDSGIGMVHQHFTLVPRLTVIENLALGVRSGGRGLHLPYPRIRKKLDKLRQLTGFAVTEDVLVEDLSAGDRQRLEILKLLVRDPEILIFDEPTAVLAPQEVTGLIRVFRKLASDGRTVFLIAHKLDEVLAAADRITVLRNGSTVHECVRSDVDVSAITRAMVGKEVLRGPKVSASAGPVIAKLVGVWATGAQGQTAVTDVNLEVKRGEIVGIAGVDGNGQMEFSEILAGVRSAERGAVELPDQIGFIPADRLGEALIGSFDLSENQTLALMSESSFRQGPLIRWAGVRARAAEAKPTSSGFESLDTKTASGRLVLKIALVRAYQASTLATRHDTRNPYCLSIARRMRNALPKGARDEPRTVSRQPDRSLRAVNLVCTCPHSSGSIQEIATHDPCDSPLRHLGLPAAARCRVACRRAVVARAGRAGRRYTDESRRHPCQD